MTETTLERWMRKPHFTCPVCDATSWNPNDIANLYCGRCHRFFAYLPLPLPLPEPDMRQGAPRDPVGVRKASKRAIEALAPNPRERAREDDTPGFQLPTFPVTDPDPPSDPSSSIDPGGGSSGGGGASGDY